MIVIGKPALPESALRAMAAAGITSAALLSRHARRDSGDILLYKIGIIEEDLAERLMSIYLLSTGDATCITTLLLMSIEWLAEFRLR